MEISQAVLVIILDFGCHGNLVDIITFVTSSSSQTGPRFRACAKVTGFQTTPTSPSPFSNITFC